MTYGNAAPIQPTQLELCAVAAPAPLSELRHPDVRNLAWLIASAPLLRDLPPWHRQHCTPPPASAVQFDSPAFWQQHASHYAARLRQLDSAPRPLLQALAQQKSSRLGRYAETLLHFWLTDGETGQYHPYRVLEYGVQLFNQHRQTTGELDFVVYNHATQEVEHWELALKYYLLDAWQPNHCSFAWKGLHSNDSLGKKLSHMLTQPFQTQRVADTTIQTRKIVLKGRLFSPARYARQPLPPWLESHLPNGIWHPCASPNHVPANWIQLPRKQWLALPERTETQPNKQPDNETTENTSGMYLNPHTGRSHMLRFII